MRVDGLDGVMFEPGEAYLTLATWRDDPSTGRASVATDADYTGMQPYFRSLQERETDTLTMYDYLWRWDTDWFWCSGAFGLHNPRVRRLWPRRWRRSDVYHKLVGLENRFGVVARIDRARGKPERERVIQDIEVPVDRAAEFLRWFDDHVAMRPVWLCPLRASRAWPSYPLRAGGDLRQRRLLGHRRDRARCRRRRRQPCHRGRGDRARRPQVALLRRLLRPGDLRPALRRREPQSRQEAHRPGRAGSWVSTRRR